MKRILVLGGGFAGIQAAIELQKSKNMEVTLVSERDYFYIYPISIWIPVHIREFDDVKVSLFDIQKKHSFKLIIDKVTEIHSMENKVICENNILPYDYLIVAIGAEKMKHNGIENTLSVCGKPEMSVAIKNKLDELILRGNGKIAIGFGGNPKDASAVRGGPAFELIFNIHTMLKKEKIRDNFELTFFAPMQEPGAKMGPDSLAMLDKMFEKYNIKKRFGKKITEFQKSNIIFEDNTQLEADLIMFIPASSSHSVLKKSDLSLSEAGFIKVDDSGLVENTDNVYAAGDIAFIKGYDWVAKQGHIAELMGRNAAFNIIEKEKKSDLRKGYFEHLNILCVMDTGNGAAFVFRNSKKSFIVPLPIVGHWMKKAWGHYSKSTKLGRFPRLPGM